MARVTKPSGTMSRMYAKQFKLDDTYFLDLDIYRAYSRIDGSFVAVGWHVQKEAYPMVLYTDLDIVRFDLQTE